MSLSDQIRRAVDRSGLTLYRIAAEAGVQHASLSRFMRGSGATTKVLDAVAEVLRIEITFKGPRQALIRKHDELRMDRKGQK